MKMLSFWLTVIALYALCDFNYFARTIFTVLSGRVNQKRNNLTETTVVYGLCTFQDCDVWFKNIRLARLVRELDFARYHFYDRTGIYQRSKELSIKSLQGSTLTITEEPVPMFAPYKITTELVYWDDRSLFLEHKIVTLYDSKVRCFLVSRQYAVEIEGPSAEVLLKGLPGFKKSAPCPKYIQCWLKSMEVSSAKLRRTTDSSAC